MGICDSKNLKKAEEKKIEEPIEISLPLNIYEMFKKYNDSEKQLPSSKDIKDDNLAKNSVPINTNNNNLENLYEIKEVIVNTSQNLNALKNINNNFFPRYTKYEKELNSKFKYFNVFWYDPDGTKDFETFIKCFENVQFYKDHDLKSAINFFKKESIYEWIVITPGGKGKELILNLENFECIKSFFIYCRNPFYHSWANNIKKVGCITYDPRVLCQKFIDLNESYIFPNCNYQENNDTTLNLIENDPELIIDIKSPILKPLFESKNKVKNKYNIFCIKLLNYISGNEIVNDIEEAIIDKKNPLMTLPTMNKDFLKIVVNSLKKLCLLSFYFNNYPYLFNLLSFQEVKDLLNSDKGGNDDILESEYIIEKLYQKIVKNECILDDKDKLKKLQISLIQLIPANFRLFLGNNSILANYYQIINYFRDLDFCLKLIMIQNISGIINKKNNFVDELMISLLASEPRYPIYLYYVISLVFNLDKSKKELNQDIINETLTIKDFIVLGDINFHEKIKTIEMYIKSKSFKYITLEQISNYLNEKKLEERNTIITYFYFLIIRFEEYQKNLENIILLSFKSGVTFLIFLYIEKDIVRSIPKNYINFIIPTILVYSPQDILYYLSQKLGCCISLDMFDIKQLFGIKIPKITFEQNDEDYQNGCFELTETFDVNIIRNNLVLRFIDDIDYVSEFTQNIYNIYKENNALDLFYQQNCPYLGWILYPELKLSSNICFVKRFLYLYCREETPSEKSLYRIVNEELKSRDPNKIYRYINIIALINHFIEDKSLRSFNGIVYRATKLDENLILKLVPGGKVVNTAFFSTSKNFEEAEKFMVQQIWRNSYIICKNVKTNIDIDYEGLNPFNEQEVLFIPFTEFRVDNVSYQINYGKKIFIIELTELGNRNFVNSDNMQIQDVNNLGMKKWYERILRENQNKLKNLMFKEIFGNNN